jgi:hypothetical protein
MSNVQSRMSAGVNSQRHVRDLMVNFNIHATEVDGSSQTAKEIAADLADEVMKVFGGHPTVSPTAEIDLDYGHHLITRYETDYGVRTGDHEFQWVIQYIFRVDVPVAV